MDGLSSHCPPLIAATGANVSAGSARTILMMLRDSESNSYVTINRLPTELLSKILLLARQNVGSTSRDNLLYVRQLTELSSVCRHWRSVAVNDGRFWSTIPFTRSPELNLLLAERTKHTARFLLAKYSDYALPVPGSDPYHDWLATMTKGDAKIHGVEFHFPYHYLLHHLDPLLINVAPNLEHFSISCEKIPCQLDPLVKLSSITLMKQLHHAEFIGWVDWRVTIHPNLSYLKIWPGYSELPLSSGGTILEALRAIPGLRELHLAYSLPVDEPTFPLLKEHEKIRFPRLEVLRLQARPGAMDGLLCNIAYPFSTQLHIELPSDMNSDTTTQASLMGHIRSRYSRGLALPSSLLVTLAKYRGTLAVKSHSRLKPYHPLPSYSDSDNILSHHESTFTYSHRERANDELKSIFELGFPTSSLSCLYLDISPNRSINVADVFGFMNLRSIIASRTEGANAVVEALRAEMPVDTDSSSVTYDFRPLSSSTLIHEEPAHKVHLPVIFPQLESLTLFDVDFKHTHFKPRDLVITFSLRKAGGHRLLSLEIRDSSYTGWCSHRVFGELREVVGEVVWDGKCVLTREELKKRQADHGVAIGDILMNYYLGSRHITL